jgi:pSer/pThr/pTyr-binding forkhead associated (FHA) protein
MRLKTTIITLISMFLFFGTMASISDSKTIYLLLDNSGSMKKNDPDFMMKRTVETFIKSQNDQTSIGIISFDTNAETLLVPVQLNSQASIEKCIQSLEKIDYKGAYTNITAAVELAVYQLKNATYDSTFKAIVLVTDGYIDTGDKNLDVQKRSLLIDSQSKAAKDAGIKIFGVAFTENADFELMQTISIVTDGNYFRAFNPEELAGIFIELDKNITDIKKSSSEENETTAVEPEPEKKQDNSIYFMILALLLLSVSIYMLSVRFKRGKRSMVSGTLIPSAYLIDKNNHFNKKEFLIENEITSIGRAKENDMCLKKEDKTVTGFNHAQVLFRNNKFFLKDNSTNFTKLNNVKLEKDKEYELNDGDEILIVKYPLTFKFDDRYNSTELIDMSGTVIIQGDENVYSDQPDRSGSDEETPLKNESDPGSKLESLSESDSDSESDINNVYNQESNLEIPPSSDALPEIDLPDPGLQGEDKGGTAPPAYVDELVLPSAPPDEPVAEEGKVSARDNTIENIPGKKDEKLQSEDYIEEKENTQHPRYPIESDLADSSGEIKNETPQPEFPVDPGNVMDTDNKMGIQDSAEKNTDPGLTPIADPETNDVTDQNSTVDQSFKTSSDTDSKGEHQTVSPSIQTSEEPQSKPFSGQLENDGMKSGVGLLQEPEFPEISLPDEPPINEPGALLKSDPDVPAHSMVQSANSDITSTIFQIPCKNHPDRQAVQICDECLKPFCMDCLEKNGNSLICKDCLEKKG